MDPVNAKAGADAPAAPATLSELLGNWKAQGQAVMSSMPFDGQPRLDDWSCLAYGGPYMVGESMSRRTAAFLAEIPRVAMLLEEAADLPCLCVPPSEEIIPACVPCRCRVVLKHWKDALTQ